MPCIGWFARTLPHVLAIFAFTATSQAQRAPLIPREHFFSPPTLGNVQISPDGKLVSFLAPDGSDSGITKIFVQTIGASDARPIATAARSSPQPYFWADNGHQIIYSLDRNGGKNDHIYAFDTNTAEEIDLTQLENIQARILSHDRNFPDEILVAINDRDPLHHDVWKINTLSGERSLIFLNDAGYELLQADSQYQVRLAGKRNPGTNGLDLYVRDSTELPWYELTRWSAQDAQSCAPVGFSRSGQSVYLLDTRGQNTIGLHRYSAAADGTPLYEVIAASQRTDVAQVLIDPYSGSPQAVMFEYERKRWQILDVVLDRDWKFLTTADDGDLAIVSRDAKDLRWIVRSIQDDGPTRYFLFDRKSRELTFLFSDRPDLELLRLAEMKPVIIPARDGLNLVSYVTLPSGRSGRHLPMVLLVHDGPWERDRWGYRGMHQWLANRGYAVLSVNFRGSTGFGREFLNAGDREWAGKMHSDLIDAVNWAVQQEIANPDRIAIMGCGYGGYAAMIGLTFTPDFFAAAVNIGGPLHVRTLMESIDAPERERFENRVGSISAPAFLEQISPLPRAPAIRKPLLIAHGEGDARIREAEALQIIDMMSAKGLPATYVLFEGEGDQLLVRANRLASCAIIESFLAEHLGGRCESLGDSIAESSARFRAGADLINNSQ